jgi:hypothetical protein
MNDLDALSVIHLIANSWESSDYFEIHSVAPRSIFVHQIPRISFSSSPSLIASLRYALSHFRWSEPLIDDWPPPPASSCSRESDPNLWSKIRRLDCKATQYHFRYSSRFGTDDFNHQFRFNQWSILANFFRLSFVDWYSTKLLPQFSFNLNFPLWIGFGTDWYRAIQCNQSNLLRIIPDFGNVYSSIHITLLYCYVQVFNSSSTQ